MLREKLYKALMFLCIFAGMGVVIFFVRFRFGRSPVPELSRAPDAASTYSRPSPRDSLSAPLRSRV